MRSHYQRRVPLAHTFQAVADVLNGHRVRQPQVQLVQHRHGIAGRQKPVRHIRQYIEQQGIPQALGRRQHAAHAEDQESVSGDICVSVEERCIRPHAQGVQAQQHLLQQLLCVQRTRLVVGQFLLHEFVQIRKNRVVLRRKLAKVCFLCNAPTGIQFGQHDLYGVQLRVGEILVRPEEVFQKGDVPSQ